MIHILLPVHNRIAFTRAFVDCLIAQTTQNFRLVLIDDGSTDGTAEMAASRIPRTKVIRGTGDWWWGGSLHQGYSYLSHEGLPADDLVLIMNDDTTFNPDFLVKLEQAMNAGPPRRLLVAIGKDTSGRVLQQGMKVDWVRLRFRQSAPGEVSDWAPTRGLCMRVRDFLDIGGFYPRLLPHYLSDVEYTIRARRRGYSIETDDRFSLIMSPEATGEHEIRTRSIFNYVRRLFSKRASHNPVYMTLFVILAAPWWAVPTGILKSWLLPFVEIAGYRRRSA